MSFNFRVLRGTLLVLAFVFASCLSVARSEPFDNASDVISRTDPVSEQVDATAHTPKVFSHFIVGNTYNYTVSTWANDIAIAHSKGIDAFALNVGADYWEPSQVANAYSAAAQLNTTFKLFISFDMTSLPCTSASDINILQYYINTYASHPNQQLYRGRVFTSAFAGESCTFGAATLNDGWISAVKTNVAATYFVPAFFVNPAIFPNLTVMDGGFNWNSGWPMGDYDIDFGPDESYISALDGRSYMAAASPWFFTHYGPDSYNKNFIYRSDDWLWAERWELLVQNRTSVPFTEVVSWNDYGESHYIGPVEGIQPNSQAWVDGFDHQGGRCFLSCTCTHQSNLLDYRLAGPDALLHQGIQERILSHNTQGSRLPLGTALSCQCDGAGSGWEARQLGMDARLPLGCHSPH
ncbi:hypothetical protein AcV5_002948 [Taiwanofungus camphoratus]|nr:hypothetical protein AcV5_002948 [Antrodia cinnamomea]